MKLLLVAPYCFGLETSLARAFRENGCEVQTVFYGKHDDKPAAEKAIHNHPGLVRFLKRSLSATGLLQPMLRRRLQPVNDEVLRVAASFSPEIVLIVKGEVLLPDTVRRLGESAEL